MSHTSATLTPLTDTSTASMFAAMNAANTQAKANATTGSSGSSDSGSDSNSLSVTNLGSTFLELLSQELQNQDPTSPVDPTQMVGQMISLNQLDQLIGINQTLTDAANGTASGSGSGTPSGSGAQAQGPLSSAASIADPAAPGSPESLAAGNAAAAQAYMNAAGALLAGTPASSGAQPSVNTFNVSNLNALSGGK